MNTHRKPESGGNGRKVWVDFGASYTVQMNVEEWVALPDHPRQRDTLRHARKAHWQGACESQGAAFESQRFVVAGEYADQVFKVDGHTRGLLWTQGQLRSPPFVVATVLRCKTRDELNQLYDTYHAPLAAHTQFDRVTGAYREQGLQLKSERLRGGHIAVALEIAWRAVNSAESQIRQIDRETYEAIEFFAPELKLLDSANPQPDVFYTGVVSAALLGLAADTANFEFFRRLAIRQGNKHEGLLDPVEAVLASTRALKRKPTARERAQQEELCWRALHAMQIWRAGPDAQDYWANALPKPLDAVRRAQIGAEIQRRKEAVRLAAPAVDSAQT